MVISWCMYIASVVWAAVWVLWGAHRITIRGDLWGRPGLGGAHHNPRGVGAFGSRGITNRAELTGQLLLAPYSC